MRTVLLIVLCLNSLVFSKDLFVATDGKDTNSGSKDAPLATLMKAQDLANTGDTVYIRGGEYKNFKIAKNEGLYNYVHYFSKGGITYKAYNNEKVVFNFKGDYTQGKYRVTGFFVKDKCNDVTFEQIEIINIPTLTYDQLVATQASKLSTQSEAFHSQGGNTVFKRCVAHDNNGIGFYYSGNRASGTVIQCDAYRNYGIDKASLGNADGFGAHGAGVKFIECRAWDNSDDNFDCINSPGANSFYKCWAFKKDFSDSQINDGNGFKIGGWNKSPDHKYGDKPPVHQVEECISVRNKQNGFYANHQPGQAAVWKNNRAYDNKANFNMLEGNEEEKLDSSGLIIDAPGTREELYNNVAYKFNKNLAAAGQNGKDGNLYNSNLPESKNKYNSWNYGLTLQDSDFVSLDISQLSAPRKSDGSLPDINFMDLNPNGPNYSKLKKVYGK